MRKRRKRIPRASAVPTIINKAVRFATIHAVVDKIERGEIDVVVLNGKDVPVYNDLVDGGMYELIPAMRGWCTFIEKMGGLTRKSVSLNAHQAIIATLENGDDIHQADLDAMRVEIREHEAVHLLTTPEQRASIAKTCQVLFQMESLGMLDQGKSA